MPRLLKSPEAENDLEEIWWYVAQDNLQSADQLLDQIQEAFLALANFPQMGVGRDELRAGLRSQPVGSYLIFYLSLGDGIDVVRVMHGSRDVKSLL
jgi:toxin ParE1/3/4